MCAAKSATRALYSRTACPASHASDAAHSASLQVQVAYRLSIVLTISISAILPCAKHEVPPYLQTGLGPSFESSTLPSLASIFAQYLQAILLWRLAK